MLISVVTRTYKRPKMFAANRQSLKMQTLQDYEEIVIRDEVGIGCAEANHRLCLVEPKGDYVWVFDDDDVLEDDTFFEKVKETVDQFHPDVIFVKGWIVGQILPDRWPIEEGHIDGINYVVSREMWDRCKNSWDRAYAGDFSFINAVMKLDPHVRWLDIVAAKTIRGSHGAVEEWDFELPQGLLSRDPNRARLRPVRDMMHIGDIIQTKDAVAGIGFIAQKGEKVTVTRENFDKCEGLIRSDIAKFVSSAPMREVATQKVLIFCPIGGKLEQKTRDAIFAQEDIENYDIIFAHDNPHSPMSENAGLNIQLAYEKMRTMALQGKYDKVWICEADMIPPKDALKKLLEVDAEIVTGLYILRHAAPNPNIVTKDKQFTLFSFEHIKKNWGKQITVGGGCMGCVLIDKSVLERFSFILKDNKNAPDIPFMEWCIQNEIRQVARLDVVCGHVKPTGEVLWPSEKTGFREEKSAA